MPKTKSTPTTPPPALKPGDAVRVAGGSRVIVKPPFWVDGRWRVLTGTDAFEQFVDCDKVELDSQLGLFG